MGCLYGQHHNDCAGCIWVCLTQVPLEQDVAGLADRTWKSILGTKLQAVSV